MKPSLVPILFCLFIFACHSSKKEQVGNQKAPSINKTDSTNKEYLDWDSVRLNGVIPMISNYRDVVNKFGKPDSIAELTAGVNGSYYHKKFQECYFKGLIFEKYNDTLVFSKIDFREAKTAYLGDNKINFRSSSTDNYFHKLFPYSFLNTGLTGTDMDKYLYIALPTSSKNKSDGWIFTFKAETGDLLSIDHADAPDRQSKPNN